MGPAESDIDFDIIRNDNDTFTVKYTPPGAGSYTIMVLFADQVTLVCWCVLACIWHIGWCSLTLMYVCLFVFSLFQCHQSELKWILLTMPAKSKQKDLVLAAQVCTICNYVE